MQPLHDLEWGLVLIETSAVPAMLLTVLVALGCVPSRGISTVNPKTKSLLPNPKPESLNQKP